MATTTSRLTIAINSKQAQANADALSRSLNKTTTAGTKASAAARITAASYRAAATAAAGYIGALSVGAITTDLQKLQGINSRLSALTGDLAGNQAWLSTTSRELSADYIALADGYSKLLPLYESGVVSLTEARELTEGLANVQAATGASSASLGQSIYGLSQTLAAGTVNMEDYRQVVDSLPGLNNKVAAAFGLTTGELKTLIASGTLTSEMFKGPLLKAFQDYSGAAAALSGNIEQTFNRTKNAYLEAVAAFNEPISGVATTSAEAVAAAFELVAENSKLIVDAAQLAGVAIAANYGGTAITSLASYTSALAQAATRTTALKAIQQGALATTNAQTAARLVAATAAAKEAAANVLAAQSAVARTAGTEAAAVAGARLTAAREAATVATVNLTRAETAAIAATGRLTVAQRAAAVSATAMGTAAGGLSTALALLGGPAGAAIIALGGIAYLATRQTEAEKAAISLKDAMLGLNDAYKSNAQAASDAANSTIESQKANLYALKQEYANMKAALEEALGASGAGIGENNILFNLLGARIAAATEELDKFTAANERLKEKAKLDETAAAYAAYLGKIVDDSTITAEKMQAAYDKLLPKDSKIAELKRQLSEFETAFNKGLGIDDSEIAAVRKVIAAQIADLEKLGSAQDKSAETAAEYADRVKAAYEIAFPEKTRIAEQEAQLDLLRKEYEKGGPAAEKYGDALAALESKFEFEAAEHARESVQKFNDILDRPVNDPFASYRTDIKLLDDALAELPDRAMDINLAMSRLDLDIVADLTVVEASGNRAVTQAAYAAQMVALDEYHALRQTTEEGAQQNIIALAQSYAAQMAAIHDEEFAKLQSFQDQFSVRPDLAGINLEASYDGAKAQAAAITDSQTRSDTLLGIEQTYQDRATELVRAGEATRAQIQSASAADQFAGLINSNQEQISAISGFVEAALSLRSNREKLEADAALATARNLADAATEAQAVYKRTGLETDRILAEQAEARAAAAEATAKREFEQQKKAQLQQARLSQLLAIMNAYATGGNWITGVAFAATAGLVTQQVIDNIKAQQFNGGSSTISNTSSAQTYTPVTQQTQPQAQLSTGGIVERVYIVSGNFRSEDEAIAEAARAQQKASDRNWITYPSGTPDFKNIPKQVVRING